MGTLREDQYTFMISGPIHVLRNVSDKTVEEIKPHYMFNPTPPPPKKKKNRALYEILWKNIVELDMP
jgi:hypothetical protein